MDEGLKNVLQQLSGIKLPNEVAIAGLEQMNSKVREFEDISTKIHRDKEADRANALLQTKLLEKIESNTNWIANAVNLLVINNDYQAETLGAIQEILSLALLNDEEQVNQKSKDIIGKLHDFKDNYELYEFLNTMFFTVKETVKMKINGEL